MAVILRAFILACLIGWAAPAGATISGMLVIPTNGTYTLNVNVPNTRDGGNWPMQVDVYTPSTYNNAQVIIPGATGTAYSIAYQFRVTTVNAPVSSSSQVNWALLQGYKSVVIAIHTVNPNGGIDKCNYGSWSAGSVSGTTLTVSGWDATKQYVLPGKQAIYAGTSPYTAVAIGANITAQLTGTTGQNGTYSLDTNLGTIASEAMLGIQTAPTAPNTTTSCNHVETDGQDDIEFYKELSAWISAGCGGNCGTGIGTGTNPAGKNITGFSNGGMLVSRLWCENNGWYARYASISGPQSYDWFHTQTCTPAATVKPYFMTDGALDTALGICTGCTSQSDNNWAASQWTGQNPTLATINPPATYIPSSIYVCAAANSYAGSTVCSGGSVPQYGSGGFNAVATHTAVKVSYRDTWCYGGASCPIRLDYFYAGAHNPSSDEAACGCAYFSTVLAWEASN